MVPLVADIHFNPMAADVAAQYIEKVRINTGNYVDAARTFKHLEYTDEDYAQELQKIHDRFVPFLNICKEKVSGLALYCSIFYVLLPRLPALPNQAAVLDLSLIHI